MATLSNKTSPRIMVTIGMLIGGAVWLAFFIKQRKANVFDVFLSGGAAQGQAHMVLMKDDI